MSLFRCSSVVLTFWRGLFDAKIARTFFEVPFPRVLSNIILHPNNVPPRTKNSADALGKLRTNLDSFDGFFDDFY